MALTKLTQNLIDGTIVTSVNGSSGAVTLETGTDWQTTIQTSNFTAVAGKGYFVNTTSAEITVTLPVGVVGTEIAIQDYAGTFATNKVIFASNGSEKIQGVTDDFKCKINNATVILIYQDATKGWTADNIVTNAVPALTVNYLLVAGGGGTDLFSGGGGAGGLRTSFPGSTNGGGSSIESTFTLAAATNYSITIGAGGTGVGYVSPGGTATGSNSSFNSIVSNGGGGGSYQTGPTGGGSGGGAGCGSNPGSYNGGTRSTSPTIQGYNGGNSGPRNGTGYPTGGGGGAGGAGQNYVSGTQAGNGGVGLSNAITVASGTGPYYAGGGGGAVINNNTAGTGGNGGGGDGINGSATPNNGQANTGGGGGGASNSSTTSVGSNGGSGIVILRYPSAYIISGLSGTTTTVGTDKVTTFTNAGTGNIQFN